MSRLYLQFTISKREKVSDVVSLCSEYGADINLVTLGHGTATSEIRNLLGLGDIHKAFVLSFVSDEIWAKLKKALLYEIGFDVPGTGISFVVPVGSIGGRREFEYITDGLNIVKEKESTMKGTRQDLLVVICNQGCSELVMDAARTAGAGGGTVIHARGTGTEKAEKFLGISLASEKDVIYIVTSSGRKDAIMQAIMKNAGTDTEAKAIVFSLPVEDSIGIRPDDSME